VIAVVARRAGLSLDDMTKLGTGDTIERRARRVATRLLSELCCYSHKGIGDALNRERSSVSNALRRSLNGDEADLYAACYAELCGEEAPPETGVVPFGLRLLLLAAFSLEEDEWGSNTPEASLARDAETVIAHRFTQRAGSELARRLGEPYSTTACRLRRGLMREASDAPFARLIQAVESALGTPSSPPPVTDDTRLPGD